MGIQWRLFMKIVN